MAEAHDKRPLAERMRPRNLDDFIGQEHLLGKTSVLRQAVESGTVPSMIFWGPPGVGKTTMAHIIAENAGLPFYALSAISSGVKDLRKVIEEAEAGEQALLFIDEIHRFNKAQQDALLGAVERGTIVLIGATTENPSFEVISALLSRCQVYILKPHEKDDLVAIAHRAIKDDEILQQWQIEVKEWEAMLRLSGGDARRLLNVLELVVNSFKEKKVVITDELVMERVQQKMALYDKTGEQHYDIISAFIKSMRGSDPNAAVYWLARMLEGGEDPKFIARRMLILASEDIGNANPNALLLATSTFQAIDVIGMPEARIILSQCATYLASSAKSNASYEAIGAAQKLVRQQGDLPVPLHLRNAPTKLMKQIGYGKDYQYSHGFQDNFSAQEYLPEKLSGTKIYDPGKNPREEQLRQFLKQRWKGKYGY
ncbi:MAG: replication-associated recombination protein A [Bacteroidia bacterium]